MKAAKIAFVWILILLAQPICAQEINEKDTNEVQNLFANVKSSGIYAALTFRYTEINKSATLINGGRIAWLINKKLGIGAAGLGFVNKPISDSILDGRYSFTGGMGGLLIEPILYSDKAIHLAFPVVIGIGGINYSNENRTFGNHKTEASDVFWVIEPGIEIEMNFFEFFRLNLGVYYPITPDIFLNYRLTTKTLVSQDVLHRFSCGLTLKFGKFN